MTATIGNEMFDMFTERRENLNINLDLSNIRSNAQLRDYMIGQYGEKLTEAIMAHWHSPKTIEHKPQLEAHSDALKGDSETLDTELEANNQGLDEAENRDGMFDRDRASPRHSDLERLAHQSLANSKPPKV